MADLDFQTPIQSDAGGGFVSPQNDAGESFAAVLREEGFDPRQMTGESVPVLDAGQRAVDPGGTDFQRPGTGDGVID